MINMISKISAELKDRLVNDLLNIKDIVLYEPVTLASRVKARYYIDIKRSYGEPGILRQYTNCIFSCLGFDIQDISCVVGSGYGGVSLATALHMRSEMWNIRLCMIRSELKNHGILSLFDGHPLDELNKKKKLLIVDDVFTTGGSIKKGIIDVLPQDLEFEIFVICNRSGLEEPEIDGVKVNYLITPEDLKTKSL